MGELIQINQEAKPPLIICPHCKQEILIDIIPFSKDVSKILRDNCVKCGGEINVGIFILSDVSMRGLLNNIAVVIQSLEGGNVLLT